MSTKPPACSSMAGGTGNARRRAAQLSSVAPPPAWDRQRLAGSPVIRSRLCRAAGRYWRFPMPIPSQPDQELDQRLAAPLLDVLIRAGLILAMAMLCYQVLSPFLTLMVWALILAITLYPLHQALASQLGGKQGLAATLVVVVGIVLIVAPTAMLLSSLGDSVQHLIHSVQHKHGQSILYTSAEISDCIPQ